MSVGQLLAEPKIASGLSPVAPKLVVKLVPAKYELSPESFKSFASDVHDIYSQIIGLDDFKNTPSLSLAKNEELKSIVEDSRLEKIANHAQTDLFGGTRVKFEKSNSFDSGEKYTFRFSEMQKQASYASMHNPPEFRDRVLGRNGRHLEGPPPINVDTGSLAILKSSNGKLRLEITQNTPGAYSMKSFELVA